MPAFDTLQAKREIKGQREQKKKGISLKKNVQ